jgi:hypothetical protein
LNALASMCGSCTSQFCDHSMAEVALRYAETLHPMVPLEVQVVSWRVSEPACSIGKKLHMNERQMNNKLRRAAKPLLMANQYS